MRILVAGRSGQIAMSLAACAERSEHEIIAVGRPELDLCDPCSIQNAVSKAAPDVIINAAAYTAVDKAEDDEATAFAVNAEGAGYLAEAAAAASVPIVHLSTDYVFDGAARNAYREDDATAPLGAYGRSKLAGEIAVRAANPQHLIVRTAWVYSPFGSNFVKTMLRLAEGRDEVRVVDDQLGHPTYALDITEALLAMCDRLQSGGAVKWGIYHMTGQGAASWADFAEVILTENALQGGASAKVVRIASEDFPTRAKRPANSRLDTAKLSQGWGIALPPWELSVRNCISRILEIDD